MKALIQSKKYFLFKVLTLSFAGASCLTYAAAKEWNVLFTVLALATASLIYIWITEARKDSKQQPPTLP